MFQGTLGLLKNLSGVPQVGDHGEEASLRDNVFSNSQHTALGMPWIMLSCPELYNTAIQGLANCGLLKSCMFVLLELVISEFWGADKPVWIQKLNLCSHQIGKWIYFCCIWMDKPETGLAFCLFIAIRHHDTWLRSTRKMPLHFQTLRFWTRVQENYEQQTHWLFPTLGMSIFPCSQQWAGEDCISL